MSDQSLNSRVLSLRMDSSNLLLNNYSSIDNSFGDSLFSDECNELNNFRHPFDEYGNKKKQLTNGTVVINGSARFRICVQEDKILLLVVVLVVKEKYFLSVPTAALYNSK